jgi:hypothetical protein
LTAGWRVANGALVPSFARWGLRLLELHSPIGVARLTLVRQLACGKTYDHPQFPHPVTNLGGVIGLSVHDRESMCQADCGLPGPLAGAVEYVLDHRDDAKSPMSRLSKRG